MMPSAKKALMDGGLQKKEAHFAQIGLFLVGALGIQLLSRAMHHFIPSHIVDCDHTHEEDEDESEELLSCADDEEAQDGAASKCLSVKSVSSVSPRSRSSTTATTKAQWKALPEVLTSKKVRCDDEGQCYGYSDPCSGTCFWKLQSSKDSITARPGMLRSVTTSAATSRGLDEHTPLIGSTFQPQGMQSVPRECEDASKSSTLSSLNLGKSNTAQALEPHHNHNHHHDRGDDVDTEDVDQELGGQKSHHHHVPTNAFLSLGVQTSLAIALHKLPEGFITYATNHANPQLGVTVFLSLFIHNITEGFALALPLYLALQSRMKAMAWSAILGGLSQPVGAGIAALWFHVAGTGNWAPGEAMYGGMFAIVAGIMANVGMQLMGEAWALGHDRNLCILFAFIGMGILGFSSALTK